MFKFSKLVENLGEMNADDDVVVVNIDVETCKPVKETLESVKEFVALINASEPSVFEVGTADISQHISQAELSFLNKHVQGENRDDMLRIMQAGCFLQMETLYKLCGLWFACEFMKRVDAVKGDDEKAVQIARDIFVIEDDWNPEQKAVMAEQLKYAKQS